jgi:hypothetical protein
MEAEECCFVVLEEAIDMDVVKNGFADAWARGVVGDLCIEKAVKGETFCLEIDTKPACQEHVGLTGLDTHG